MRRIFKKIQWWLNVDRLGPDIPLTHFLLHSSRFGFWLCSKKFNHFGKGSSMRPGSYVIGAKHINIGDNVVIRPGTMLFAVPDNTDSIYVTVGDNALIGAGVHVYVSNHSFEDTSMPIYFQGHNNVCPVTISEGCWIGANAVILPGVTVGKNAVVGAGSVVTKDVQDFTVVVGQPAKMIKLLKKESSQL